MALPEALARMAAILGLKTAFAARVLVKVIALRDASLAQKITLNSNNQNAIKPRDLRSNHDIMLRLKEEFKTSGEAYHFEIKRGEKLPTDKTIIPNDVAGRMLLAFDLYQPYSCHQLYRIFDEEYADIFGRKEVDCYRIIFLWNVMKLIEKSLPKIDNPPFGNYGLTKYFLLYVVAKILDDAAKDSAIVANPKKYWGSQSLSDLYGKIDDLLKGIIVDLNYEVKAIGDAFDYKADLKSPTSVEEWGNKLIRDYQKDVARGKAVAFD
jgi:AIPR protein